MEFAKTESIVTVQRRFRIEYHTETLTDKIIPELYMNSSRVAACALETYVYYAFRDETYLLYISTLSVPRCKQFSCGF